MSEVSQSESTDHVPILPKRAIFPMYDWDEFLADAKREFSKLFEIKFTNEFGREEFDFIKTLGKGAFGRVYLAKQIKSKNYFAIKVLEKAGIVKSKQVKHAINEKRILQSLNFPFCVYLTYAFMDNSYLYLGLPFVSGGEMFTLLQKMKRFEERLSLFYGAQVLLAFEYLHYCDLIFRDLKPENILIDKHGYLKLTDFGFCKVLSGRTYTLCGTPEYLAPEIVLNKGYGKAIDWWTYGVLLYEMASGSAPFHAKDPMKIYEKVVAGKYTVPKYFSRDLTDLISNLLQVDLTRRYGNLRGGVSDIKSHAWYREIDWIELYNGKVEPPYKPNVRSPDDSSNFDSYKEVGLDVAKKNQYLKEFADF